MSFIFGWTQITIEGGYMLIQPWVIVVNAFCFWILFVVVSCTWK